MQQKEQNTLDFSLNEEQLAIRDTCREFAQQEIKPLAEEMDRTGAFPYKLIRKMAELGLLGLPFPEEYGGAGLDLPLSPRIGGRLSAWRERARARIRTSAVTRYTGISIGVAARRDPGT